MYEQIKPWAEHRGDVTLIGGWAVYELVAPPYRMQSRDIDLIMHNGPALEAFQLELPKWGLKWREKGRNRFSDCHLKEDPDKNIVVDVFKDHHFAERVFKGIKARGGVGVKSAGGHGFLPGVEWMIADKIQTIPKRVRDRSLKQAKDLLDIHALVFHNLQQKTPRDLLKTASDASRSEAARYIQPSLELRPQNQEELEGLRLWLDQSIDEV